MNHEETGRIVLALNRAGLIGAMEGQVAIWATALEDIPYETAERVALDLIRHRTSDQRWVVPADIRAEAQRPRTVNLSLMPSPQVPQDLDGDPRRELVWQRVYRTTFADTGDPQLAMQAACDAVGIAVPRQIEAAPSPEVQDLVRTVAGRFNRDKPRVDDSTPPDHPCAVCEHLRTHHRGRRGACVICASLSDHGPGCTAYVPARRAA